MILVFTGKPASGKTLAMTEFARRAKWPHVFANYSVGGIDGLGADCWSRFINAESPGMWLFDAADMWLFDAADINLLIERVTTVGHLVLMTIQRKRIFPPKFWDSAIEIECEMAGKLTVELSSKLNAKKSLESYHTYQIIKPDTQVGYD